MTCQPRQRLRPNPSSLRRTRGGSIDSVDARCTSSAPTTPYAVHDQSRQRNHRACAPDVGGIHVVESRPATPQAGHGEHITARIRSKPVRPLPANGQSRELRSQGRPAGRGVRRGPGEVRSRQRFRRCSTGLDLKRRVPPRFEAVLYAARCVQELPCASTASSRRNRSCPPLARLPQLAAKTRGWVAAGSYPPAAPTVPGVPHSGTRLLR